MKANLLLIQVDQWHSGALSVLGHPNVRTPNLDRLAAQGALFSDATCNQPLCMPSRISMLSGQYPSTTRILGNSGSEPIPKRTPCQFTIPTNSHFTRTISAA